jgi:hypothetical protein
MHMLFIDESGALNPKNKTQPNSIFVLGGVIIPEDQWLHISKELTLLKDSYEIEGEIKWRYFASNREGGIQHLDYKRKEEVRTKIYSIVAKYKSVKIISAVVDVNKAYELAHVKDQNALYWIAYKQVIERFQYHLQDLGRLIGSKINGIVICDHRSNKDDSLLRSLHNKLLSGEKFNQSTYENLIEGVFLAPSHLSVGIQIADMVGGAIYRKYNALDDRFFNQIKGAIRERNGNIDGYGIVHWPKN